MPLTSLLTSPLIRPHTRQPVRRLALFAIAAVLAVLVSVVVLADHVAAELRGGDVLGDSAAVLDTVVVSRSRSYS